jgi:DNA-binding PadR family transcriptional regulator
MAETSVLGEFEQAVMLGVLQAHDAAYGVSIWREVETRTGRAVSLAAVYKTLDRLEVKGLARSRLGVPTPERGGRAKRMYELSPAGLRVLRASLGALARLTDGLESLLGTR